jgi:hypothetical protein
MEDLIREAQRAVTDTYVLHSRAEQHAGVFLRVPKPVDVLDMLGLGECPAPDLFR